ncbi:MAG: hypothetical protein AAF446_10425 [Pseudomonadota bacterium]
MLKSISPDRCFTSALAVLLGWLSLAHAGDDFPLELGTYLDTEPAEPIGLAFAGDGSLVVGINSDFVDGNPSSGSILRLDAVTAELLDTLWSGSPLVDFAGGSGTSSWAAVTANMRLLGNTDGLMLESELPLPGGHSAEAIAVCPGHVAVLSFDSGVSDYVARLYTRAGSEIFDSQRTDTQVADIACDPTTERVFLTGYNQVSANLQLVFVDGLSYQGTSDWRAYGTTGNITVIADTRGRILRRTDQGTLWFGGSANGGQNAFQVDPLNPNMNALLNSFDQYNQPFNLGSVNIAFYGQLDPETGALINGQFQLARLSSGRGNTVRINALDVDNAGSLHVGGTSFASMANRDSLSVQGQTVAPYAGRDPSLMVVPDDLGSRTYWTSFIDANGQGDVIAVAAAGDQYAFLIENVQGTMLTVNAPISGNDLLDSDTTDTPYAWLGTWGNVISSDLLFADSFEL